jgi:glycosyltransferase involved in cell wall biosynthesis
MSQITLIMPMYRESFRIHATLRDIEIAMIDSPGIVKKIILIDDGSNDGGKTVEKAMYFKNRLPIEFVILAKNQGKWGAINEGLKIADGLCVLCDADGSVSAKQLLMMCDTSKGVARFGTRFGKNSSVEGKSFLRSVVSNIYRLYVLSWYYMCGGVENIGDLQCPCKVFWKDELVLPIITKRFSGDVEFALRLKSKIVNISVIFNHKKGSTVRLKTIWNMLIETPKAALAGRKARKEFNRNV